VAAAEVDAIADSIATSAAVAAVATTAFYVVLVVIVPILFLMVEPASAAMMMVNLTVHPAQVTDILSEHGHIAHAPGVALEGVRTVQVHGRKQTRPYSFFTGSMFVLCKHKHALRGARAGFTLQLSRENSQLQYQVAVNAPILSYLSEGAGVCASIKESLSQTVAQLDHRSQVQQSATVWHSHSIRRDATVTHCFRKRHQLVEVVIRDNLCAEVDSTHGGARVGKAILWTAPAPP
jgi:hypothetical protein